MDREELLSVYWQYYLTLEEDFIKTIRYVSITEDNYETYSVEYARLLLAICSEVDTIFKCLYFPRISSAQDDFKNIKHYAYAIAAVDKEGIFANSSVLLKRYQRGKEIKPFSEWEKLYVDGKKKLKNFTAPRWWKAYNDVKHHRSATVMQKANLENVLNALCALFLLEDFLLRGHIQGSVSDLSLLLYHNDLYNQNNSRERVFKERNKEKENEQALDERE